MKSTPSRAKVLRDQRELIDALGPAEAQQLLRKLLDGRPDLLADAAALAGHDLRAISVKRVADQVARVVGALGVEDVWSRSGSQPDGGYVHESEAAWALLEDTMAPFLEDMARRIRLGREDEAFAICQGALLGLHRIEQKEGERFLDGHAPDLIRGAACDVAKTWMKGAGRGRPRGARDWNAMRGFVSKSLPEWRSFLIRVVGRKPSRSGRRT